MRRGLILVLAVVALALVPVSAASGVAICLVVAPACPGFPPLTVTASARVSPSKLPRSGYVPVTASVFGKVTTNGTHPPALRKAVLDIDKDVKVNAKGFPVCPSGAHYDIDEPPGGGIGEIEKTCPGAIIGRGRARFEIAFPEQKPLAVTSPLLVINGGEKGGKVTLAILTSVTIPAPREVFVTVTITRKGPGIRAVAEVPVISGGNGSLLSFSFKLGKTYSYKGKKVGYFEAKCPDGVFKVNVPELLFKNEAHTPGQEASFNLNGKLAVPCTPKPK
jgi:hypothetical protein